MREDALRPPLNRTEKAPSTATKLWAAVLQAEGCGARGVGGQGAAAQHLSSALHPQPGRDDTIGAERGTFAGLQRTLLSHVSYVK